MKIRFGLIIGCLLVALFSSCVSSPSKQSGFLTNYSRLEPDPKEEGVFFYENVQRPIYRYDAFMLSSILVYFSPEASKHGVDPEKLLKVTEYFRKSILKSFQGRYRIVPTSGPTVCSIRIAITGVVPERARMTFDHYTEEFGLSQAALEVEFQDSKTGTPVLAIWDTRRQDEYKKLRVQSVDSHARDVVHQWIKTIKHYLDKKYADEPKEKKSTKMPVPRK